MYTLENDLIQIEVSKKGAELQSLYDKAHQRQWLWQGDPQWWGKRAPILFPFVGAQKGGGYTHQGQHYAMTKHGFARDLDFQVNHQTSESLTLRLHSSPMTREVYPFDFELRLTYRLEANGLTIGHEVLNLGGETLYFSLGGHPAFNCPMDQEDWQLSFEAAETLESRCIDLKSGLILPHKKSLPSDGKPLILKSDLFKEDALVFEELKSRWVRLEGPGEGASMTFWFEGFPLLALWSPMGPFLCLEPWFGMADLTEASGELSEKYGVVPLAPAEVFKAQYAMLLR